VGTQRSKVKHTRHGAQATAAGSSRIVQGGLVQQPCVGEQQNCAGWLSAAALRRKAAELCRVAQYSSLMHGSSRAVQGSSVQQPSREEQNCAGYLCTPALCREAAELRRVAQCSSLVQVSGRTVRGISVHQPCAREQQTRTG